MAPTCRADWHRDRTSRGHPARYSRGPARHGAQDNRDEVTTIVDARAPGLLALAGVGAITFVRVALSPAGAAARPIWPRSPAHARSQHLRATPSDHRLNRGGDPRLNCALNTVVLARMRNETETRTYVERRTAQGKTRREIRRCLKRCTTRQILPRPQRCAPIRRARCFAAASLAGLAPFLCDATVSILKLGTALPHSLFGWSHREAAEGAWRHHMLTANADDGSRAERHLEGGGLTARCVRVRREHEDGPALTLAPRRWLTSLPAGARRGAMRQRTRSDKVSTPRRADYLVREDRSVGERVR